jgi:hypothetical protein
MSQRQPSSDRPTPAEEAQRLYDDVEARTAKAFDELVSRPSFGEVLARVTENVIAITRISNDTVDMVVRNLRLAGRQDLMRVGRQMARTEDKLEMVLQEVERLRDEMRAEGDNGRTDGGRKQAGRGESGRARTTEANSGGASAPKGTEA